MAHHQQPQTVVQTQDPQTVTNTETSTQTVTVAPNHQFGPNGFGNRNGN
ncbi:hypothetical protein [Mycolicibacterium vinylchloridicum]|nr:hypothetical protein [Mycolicibacterium vinylchloridicum]